MSTTVEAIVLPETGDTWSKRKGDAMTFEIENWLSNDLIGRITIRQSHFNSITNSGW